MLRAEIEASPSGRSIPTAIRSVAIGVLSVAAALILKALIEGVVKEDIAFLSLFAALPVAALAGGFTAGAIVSLLGAFAVAVMFQEPLGSSLIQSPAALARVLLYIPVSLWVAWLIAGLATSRRQASASAGRLQRLIDALPTPTLVVDPASWRIDHANDALAALGIAPPRAIGLDVREVLLDLPRLPTDGHGATSAGIRTDDAEEIPVEILVRDVQLSAGEQRWLISVHDLRAQVDNDVKLLRLARAERDQKQLLTSMIASMDDGVALITEGGDISVVNDALLAIAGRPVSSASDLGAALGVPIQDGVAELPGSRRWLRISDHVVGVDAGGPRLLVVRDITRERESEAARDAFLGVLSHELRTPVTTILGTAHLLRRSEAPASSRDRDLAHDIAEEAERLNYLIEDLLVLSRSQSGAVVVDPEPVLLQRAVREVVAGEGTRYPRITFDVQVADTLPPVNGDRTFATQVLRNLIGNAAKYGPPTPCTVTVVASAHDDMIAVRVLDEGPGFEPGDRDRLFDIFFRSATTAKAKAGSGIGLYVTRTLVEAMGGRVWASIRESGGAEFGFTLPIAPSDEHDRLPGAPALH